MTHTHTNTTEGGYMTHGGHLATFRQNKHSLTLSGIINCFLSRMLETNTDRLSGYRETVNMKLIGFLAPVSALI